MNLTRRLLSTALALTTLPPTLRGGELNKRKYLAIGESDRFTHCYVKRS